MNHTEIRGPFAPVEVAPAKLNRRQQAKAQTRGKVMQAGRELFSELGYEGATIRDIARRAGMSTGAVFANFTDKTDLFEAIVTDDAEVLHEAMRDAATAAAGSGVAKRLSALFGAGFRSTFHDLPMVRAVVIRSWMQGEDAKGRMRAQDRGAISLIVEILRDGVKAGELRGDVDARLVAELLHAGYNRNYRNALFETTTVEQVQTRMDAMVAMLIAGLKA